MNMNFSGSKYPNCNSGEEGESSLEIYKEIYKDEIGL